MGLAKDVKGRLGISGHTSRQRCIGGVAGCRWWPWWDSQSGSGPATQWRKWGRLCVRLARGCEAVASGGGRVGHLAVVVRGKR